MARHHPSYERYSPPRPIFPHLCLDSPTTVLEPGERKELLQYVRYEFDSHKDETNLDKIRYFISQGKRDFHSMEDSIDMTAAKIKYKDEKTREYESRRFQRPVVQLYRDETVGN